MHSILLIEEQNVQIIYLFLNRVSPNPKAIPQISMVALLYFDKMPKCRVLEPCSTDSLGHQHYAKKLSPKIALHFKVLCESKTTLPKLELHTLVTLYVMQKEL